MAEVSPNLSRLLRTQEAAELLGLSGRTLEKHRTYGTGPCYRNIGGRVVYAVGDLQAWADRGLAARRRRWGWPLSVPPGAREGCAGGCKARSQGSSMAPGVAFDLRRARPGRGRLGPE